MADETLLTINEYTHIEATDYEHAFTIKHAKDNKKDMLALVTLQDIQGKTSKKCEWSGLPQVMVEEIGQLFSEIEQERSPMYCLAYVLLKVKSELESLKPIDCIYYSMHRQTTLNVKKVDLFLKYELNPSEPFLSKEYNGNVLRLYRKVDKKPFIAR